MIHRMAIEQHIGNLGPADKLVANAFLFIE